MDRSKIYPETYRARFGCGFLFGFANLVFFGGGFAMLTEGSRGILMAIGIATLFGLAAAYFGDTFWRWMSRR